MHTRSALRRFRMIVCRTWSTSRECLALIWQRWWRLRTLLYRPLWSYASKRLKTAVNHTSPVIYSLYFRFARFIKLDSMRWFSHQLSPSPPGGTQWYRVLLRASYRGWLSSFSFFMPGDIDFDLDLGTRERFLYDVPNRQVWSSYI